MGTKRQQHLFNNFNLKGPQEFEHSQTWMHTHSQLLSPFNPSITVTSRSKQGTWFPQLLCLRTLLESAPHCIEDKEDVLQKSGNICVQSNFCDFFSSSLLDLEGNFFCFFFFLPFLLSFFLHVFPLFETTLARDLARSSAPDKWPRAKKWIKRALGEGGE